MKKIDKKTEKELLGKLFDSDGYFRDAFYGDADAMFDNIDQDFPLLNNTRIIRNQVGLEETIKSQKEEIAQGIQDLAQAFTQVDFYRNRLEDSDRQSKVVLEYLLSDPDSEDFMYKNFVGFRIIEAKIDLGILLNARDKAYIKEVSKQF